VSSASSNPLRREYQRESTREQPRGVMLDCGNYLPVNRAISYLNSSSSLLLPSGWWWWLVVPVVPVVPVVASSSGCLANSANLLLCFVARMERMRCKFKYCINSRLGAVRKYNFNNKKKITTYANTTDKTHRTNTTQKKEKASTNETSPHHKRLVFCF
jgi:hypothetical protein